MNNDPLDLFDGEDDGKSQPVVVRDTSGSSSSFLTLVIGVLLGIAAVGFYQRNFGDSDGGDDRKRDDQEQVEPDTIEGVEWVLIVEETGDRVRYPHLATIIGNEDYWDALEKERGIRMRPYEVDSKDLSDEHRDAAESAGLPAVLLIGDGGKVLRAKSAPASVAGIDELLIGK